MSLRDKIGYAHLPEERKVPPKNPVTSFAGTLSDISERIVTFGTKEEEQVVLGFKNVEIFESNPKYVAHTLEIAIKESTWPTSAYMLFFTSILEADEISLADAREKNLSIEDYIGRHLFLELTPQDYGVDKETGKQIMGNFWRCTAITVAEVPMSPLAVAVSLLEGKKSTAQWASAVANHPETKGNQNVSAKVVAWADEGIEKALDGIVTRDNSGFYHVDVDLLNTIK